MTYTNAAATVDKAKTRDGEITVIPDGGDVTVAVEVNADQGGAPSWVDIATIADGTSAVVESGRMQARIRLTPAASMEYKVLTW